MRDSFEFDRFQLVIRATVRPRARAMERHSAGNSIETLSEGAGAGDVNGHFFELGFVVNDVSRGR